MRKLILTTALVFAFSKADAQPFIKSLPILQDSVEIRLSGYVDFGVIPPLNRQCLCLETPGLKYKGKVLVEFMDSTSKNIAVFYGYSRGGSKGLVTSCFVMRELIWDNGRMFYRSNGVRMEMKYVTVREPSDKLFR